MGLSQIIFSWEYELTECWILRHPITPNGASYLFCHSSVCNFWFKFNPPDVNDCVNAALILKLWQYTRLGNMHMQLIASIIPIICLLGCYIIKARNGV